METVSAPAIQAGIDLYQPFTNPVTRETFRCISVSEQAFTMEWTVHPGGYVPFEHIHINQDEIFHIRQGEMRVRVGGVTRTGGTGDVLAIPRGTRHIAYNDKDEPLVCVVEYKPGLDHYLTMQCFAGLTIDCDYNKRGLVHVAKVGYMLKKAQALSLTRPAFAPEAVFRLGMNVFYLVGTVLGWESLYKRYTGQQSQ
ncbi:MAG TPA: cupin domain-containing protein [Anaerolineales bacterium]|nr:cupin domain-containing protein [Anaerolineales bacterium]